MTELENYFQFRCYKGLEQRGFSSNQEYIDRLEFEISVIKDANFIPYFLIVSDIVRWAISKGIVVGPSRGSAGGSLVSFCLYITQIDPIKYNLYFERFLNPHRAKTSFPDIDIDFQDNRRDEVIEYVKQRFGNECVANIGTYGTMKAKAAIRDVTRVLGCPYETGDKLAKLVLPSISGKEQKLQTCYEKVPQLDKYRKNTNSPEGQILYWAERFEDRIRSSGTHASAYVISDNPITDRIPLFKGKDDKPTTQYDMGNVEECGLIKFDFLGIKTLRVISICIELIKKNHGIDIDYLHLPLEDNEVFDFMSSGDLDGIFQLEGSGISEFTTKIKPKNIDDISLIVASFRPGPLGTGKIDQVIEERNGGKKPEYIFPELAPILDQTSGVCIYQEQLMRICSELAGFSLAESDTIRKMTGKKILSLVKEQREKFVSKMTDRGFDKTKSETLFSDMEGFASYSFNMCIAGDTTIYRGQTNYSQPTIEHLYKVKNNLGNEEFNKKYSSLRKKLRRLGYGKILALDNDGRIRPRHIKEIYFNGPKEVYKITLKNGAFVKATIDHKFLDTNREWRKVKDLKIGDFLIVKGKYEKNKKIYSISGQKQITKKGSYGHNKGFPRGEKNPGYIDGSYTKFKKAIEQLSHIKNCMLCGKEHRRLEHHHIDNNRNNNELHNIIKLCPSCHKKDQYKLGRRKIWEKGLLTSASEIISIDYIGVENTYDIEMNTEEHNYVANGLISHNSHSVGYGVITYWTAWFKYHYRPEFVCACLTADSNEEEKVIRYLSYCRDHGIEVLPPDINESELEFTVNKQGQIRFGLSAIKNLGISPVEKIIQERKENGPFIDIIDFCNRVDLRLVNKKKIESLVYSGAFDRTKDNRATLLDALEDIYKYKQEIQSYKNKYVTYEKRMEAYNERLKEIDSGIKKPKLKRPVKPRKPKEIQILSSLEDLSITNKINKEKELLGFYISGHPIDLLSQRNRYIKEYKSKINIKDIQQFGENKGKYAVVAMVPYIKEITTKKKKEKMAFLTLEDRTGSIQSVCFARTWAKISHLVQKDNPILFTIEAEIISETDDSRIIKGRILGAKTLIMEETQETKEIINIDTEINRLRDNIQTIRKEISTSIDNKENKINMNVRLNNKDNVIISMNYRGNINSIIRYLGV